MFSLRQQVILMGLVSKLTKQMRKFIVKKIGSRSSFWPDCYTRSPQGLSSLLPAGLIATDVTDMCSKSNTVMIAVGSRCPDVHSICRTPQLARHQRMPESNMHHW